MKEVPQDIQEARNEIWLINKKNNILETRFPPRTQKVIKTNTFETCTYPMQSTCLHGPARTGKTIAISWMTLEWCRLQFINRKTYDQFEFISVGKLLEKLRDSMHDTEVKNAYIHIFKTTKLLVLNDFGPEKVSDWAYQMLYDIIDYRYEYEKTTFFTSNLSLEELGNKLGDDRITTRIAQDCKGNIKKFTNKPYI